MKYILPLLAMLLLLVTPTFAQQSTMSFEETITVDKLGDARLVIKLTLTASQYQNWNMKYGQNKSLLKRDMGRLVSQYDTFDWNVEVKEMDRIVLVSFSAHGVVVHKGGGLYEFEVPKNWKGGDKNGTTVNYNYAEPLGSGMIGQYNIKCVLPAEATDIRDDSGSAGQKVVRYRVPVNVTSGGGMMLYGGLGSTVLGLIALGAALFAGGSKPAA